MVDVYVLKHGSCTFGNERKVFAFRNAADAQLVRSCYKVPEQRIMPFSKRVHVFNKLDNVDCIVDVQLVSHNIEHLYYQSKINGLDLDIVEKILEKKEKLMILSLQIELEDVEVTFIDRKLRMEEMFNE